MLNKNYRGYMRISNGKDIPSYLHHRTSHGLAKIVYHYVRRKKKGDLVLAIHSRGWNCVPSQRRGSQSPDEWRSHDKITFSLPCIIRCFMSSSRWYKEFSTRRKMITDFLEQYSYFLEFLLGKCRIRIHYSRISQ